VDFLPKVKVEAAVSEEIVERADRGDRRFSPVPGRSATERYFVYDLEQVGRSHPNAARPARTRL